uniref:Astacin domain-containing protein n=1 Tax=Parastrongyloides trichosuri TaxID=131310 RepID=A0A0N5A0C8_PARTI
MFFLNTLFLSFVAQIYGAIRTDYTWRNHTHIRIYSYSFTDALNSVIDRINSQTCLKLIKTNTKITSGEGINIERQVSSVPEECSVASIGPYTGIRPNRIEATEKCIRNKMELLSAVFTALGLSYEHNRNDRDDFITVNKDAVVEQKK